MIFATTAQTCRQIQRDVHSLACSTLWRVTWIAHVPRRYFLVTPLHPRTTMALHPPPNQVYSAFSFIGFVMCAIPFYWHLEGTSMYLCMVETGVLELCCTAWNTGTCLYMAWTGLGCFIQCINSIIWNHNVINRAPIYSDIGRLSLYDIAHRRSPNYTTVVHFQAGLGVGIWLPHFASTVASIRLLPQKL
jgi:hypothetical protein